MPAGERSTLPSCQNYKQAGSTIAAMVLQRSSVALGLGGNQSSSIGTGPDSIMHEGIQVFQHTQLKSAVHSAA